MNIKSTDWDNFRVFCVVADHKSISSAATSLSESAPTITRKIIELEHALGATLFHRSSRGVDLTNAGRALLKHVKLMEEASAAIQTEFREADYEATGLVKLRVSDTLGSYWIAPRIDSFFARHPGVRLQIVTQPAQEPVDPDDVHLTIHFSEPDPEGLIVRRLGVVHFIAYAAQSYLDKAGTPKSMFDLLGHQCIYHLNYIHQLDRWMPRAAEIRASTKIALLSDSMPLMLEACRHGAGIAILPSYRVKSFEGLVPIDLGALSAIQFWLTYPTRVWREPHIRAASDWLEHIFSTQESPWFQDAFIRPDDPQSGDEVTYEKTS